MKSVLLTLILALVPQWSQATNCGQDDLHTQRQPRFILLAVHASDNAIGTHLVSWTPTIAAAFKSKRFSEVHVFGNIAELIPQQSNGKKGAAYIPHFIDFRESTRDENQPKLQKVVRDLQDLINDALPGDVIVSESGRFFGVNGEAQWIQKAKERGVILIQKDAAHAINQHTFGELASINTFEGYGYTVAKALKDPSTGDRLFELLPTHRDVQKLFSEIEDAQHLREMRMRAKAFFGKAYGRPFELVNLNASAQRYGLEAGGGLVFLKLVELRIQNSQTNIVIPPFGVRDTFRDKFEELKQKYPHRIFDASELPDGGFINYLVRNASVILTPATSTSWVAKFTNLKATRILLFRPTNDLSEVPWKASPREIDRAEGGWGSSYADYFFLPYVGNRIVTAPQEKILKDAQILYSLIYDPQNKPSKPRALDLQF